MSEKKNHSTYMGGFDKIENKYARKEKLEKANTYIGQSPISGYGVFAGEDIKSGDLIEEIPVVILDSTFKENKDWVLQRYAFTWSCSCDICSKNGQSMCIPMGNGVCYNHADIPNAYYVQDTVMKLLRFYAFRDIKKDEEITWYYGDGYAQKLRDEKMNKPTGCGCGAKKIETQPETKEEVKQESKADELLFRSMIVPEVILNDKIQEGTV